MPLPPPVTMTVRPSRLKRSLLDMLVPGQRQISIPCRHVAEQNVNRLYLGVAQKLVDAFLAAKPGVLEAAERRAVEVTGRAIDPDVAGLHRARGAESGLQIIGEDRGGEAVFGRVSELERFRFVLPRKHREHRPE